MESLMLKRNIRWIIPLLVVVIVAAYFVVGHTVGAHAATMLPDINWGGK